MFTTYQVQINKVELKWMCPHELANEIDLDDWRGDNMRDSYIPAYVSGTKPASPWHLRKEGQKAWERNAVSYFINLKLNSEVCPKRVEIIKMTYFALGNQIFLKPHSLKMKFTQIV